MTKVNKEPWFDVVDADGEPMACSQQGKNIAAEVAANFGGYVIPAGLDANQRKAAVAALIQASIANLEQFKERVRKSGAIAFISGAARTSCTLAKGSGARSSWMRGYDAAKRAAGNL